MFDSTATSAAANPSGSANSPSIGAAVPPSSFVGRERESAEVKRLLAETSLLTLTGPGGVGKTRLAVEVSRDLDRAHMFADGVWFSGLAPLADAALVPQATAAALGIREQPGRPIAETIQEAMGHRRLLLVLDNCEHLVQACALLADTLLRACPGLTILATSREPLKIAGETAWPVPPLSVPAQADAPDAKALFSCEAVRLFVQRAQAAAPAFALTDMNAAAVAEICTRLDGIPLAIELAAARVRLLAPDQIADRLGDRFRLLTGGSRTALPRHQTIRALVSWSYELLPENERLLFCRLGVFAGDWSLEAAEAVASGDGIEQSEVMDLLGNLVDKSLVVAEPPLPGTGGEVRYRLLETLREYALELLTSEGNVATAAGRHARYFLEIAERTDASYWAGDEANALTSLGPEHDNVRAALRHFLDSGQAEDAARLAGGLSMFWFIRGHCIEGRAWLREVIGQFAPEGPSGSASAVYANVLLADGRLASIQDHVAAQQRLRDALAIWRRLGDDAHVANVLFLLGRVELMRGQRGAAMPLLEESLAYAERARAHTVEVLVRLWLAQIAYDDGDDDATRTQAERVLAGGDAAGSRRDACFALRLLGDVEARQGNAKAARKLLEASLAQGREVGRWLAAWPAANLADLLINQRNHGDARALLREALTTYREAGDRQGLARSLEICASLIASRGLAGQAVRLAGAAAALRLAAEAPLSPPEQIALGRFLPAAQASLGSSGASVAWADGHSLTAAQAVVEALGFLDAAEPGAREPAPIRSGPLTPREVEVAALVARGLTNRAIAAELVITEATAERHIRNIFDKLGLTSRAQLAIWAHEHGFAPQRPV